MKHKKTIWIRDLTELKFKLLRIRFILIFILSTEESALKDLPDFAKLPSLFLEFLERKNFKE